VTQTGLERLQPRRVMREAMGANVAKRRSTARELGLRVALAIRMDCHLGRSRLGLGNGFHQLHETAQRLLGKLPFSDPPDEARPNSLS